MPLPPLRPPRTPPTHNPLHVAAVRVCVAARALALLTVLVTTACHAVTDIPVAKHYRAFGPLPISSRGVDALSVFPTPLLETLATISHFPSENAVGGYATWRDATLYNSSEAGVISIPFEDAQDPYEALAVANFTISKQASHPYLLKCDHPALIQPLDAAEEWLCDYGHALPLGRLRRWSLPVRRPLGSR